MSNEEENPSDCDWEEEDMEVCESEEASSLGSTSEDEQCEEEEEDFDPSEEEEEALWNSLLLRHGLCQPSTPKKS